MIREFPLHDIEKLSRAAVRISAQLRDEFSPDAMDAAGRWALSQLEEAHVRVRAVRPFAPQASDVRLRAVLSRAAWIVGLVSAALAGPAGATQPPAPGVVPDAPTIAALTRIVIFTRSPSR